jgi:hypothetical protein
MKTSLRFTLSALTIAFPATVFGGLVGIVPASIFVGAVFLFAAVGLMLIALCDNGGARRPVVVRQTPAQVCPASRIGPARLGSSYGVRRRQCPVA